ncbi:DegT/DnrJ/EryC1/StrS family aminotransferase [Buttiauxella massiliensis]|uniref:DegT/DnrJ/EryC1/StrS family aminotransferase n=1 Tax=Buttiauxella massiliensis TaxID=2831590 RepID=UPI00125F6C0B|nr:DegT/DnrJ/EryC1/StrS family aminotransferase [Buttiauxella massiliensis]
MTPIVKVFMPPKDILMKEIEDVLYSGMIGEGEHVYTFENKFREIFDVPTGVAMSSGTAALHTALILAGVKAGDEVITTSMTAEPTNTTIVQTGGIPVFADVHPITGCLDPQSIISMVSSKTKAIVVVHYAGYLVEMKELMEKIKAINSDISVIEDCAHALGAKYDNQPVGTIGDFGIFSFQAIKHMTTVDGGFLSFKNHSLLSEAKKIRWFGMEKGIDRTLMDVSSLGYKYNMNNLTGAIGNIQLDFAIDNINKHKNNGQFFDENLENVSGVQVVQSSSLCEPSYWLYTLLSDDSDNLIKKLKSVDVMASKLHRPNHYHTMFSKFKSADMNNLDYFYSRLVHIPCGWWVSETIRETIVDEIKKG